MREILFRGKSLRTGEWIQGYLFRCWERAYIAWGMVNDNADTKEVDPETVCQYTGLTDKNGRKIFEGDIVSAPFTGYAGKTRERKGIVEFVNGAFSVNWNDSEEYGKNFAGYVNDIEVIGNIFDNPELIGDQP